MIATRHVNIAVLLGLLMLAAATSAAATTVEVDGERVSFSTAPIQVDGTVMAPVRAIGQALGAGVQWSASTQTITATKGVNSVRLTVGEMDAQVNGRTVRLPAAAMVYRGVAMVPVDFVSQALGAAVRWSESTQTMSLFTNGVPDDHPYDDPVSTDRAVVVPRGSVIPVTLDKALSSSTSTATNAFIATIRASQGADGWFPSGTQFVGTAVRVERNDGRPSRTWSVSFAEARLPGGGTMPIDGSLVSMDNTPSTGSSVAAIVNQSTSSADGVQPLRPVVDEGIEFGVRMNSQVTYPRPQYDDPWSNGRAVVIPRGSVIPVTLDRALNSSTSTATNAFSATISSGHGEGSWFPPGTQFVGTAVRASGTDGQQSRTWSVSFAEARLPDGGSVPIEGSLVPIGNTPETGGSVPGPGTSSRDGEQLIHVIVDEGTVFGVRMNDQVKYTRPQYDDPWSNGRAVDVAQGSVIPVTLDRALNWSTSTATDAFSATIRPGSDADAWFPAGTRFVGTAARVPRTDGQQTRNWSVSLAEARLPDGSRVPIDGSLVPLGDTSRTEPSGRSVAGPGTSSRDEAQPIQVVVDEDAEFGVRINSGFTYNRPQIDDSWSNDQAVVIPRGSVVPVSLDRALSSSLSRVGDAFTVTVRSSHDGDAEFPLGTRFLGNVQGVWKATGQHPGMLDLSFREAWLPDGSTVQINGSLTSLDERTVTRSRDGRLTVTTEPTIGNRLSVIGIQEGAGLLVGSIRDGRSVNGGVLGIEDGYSYREYDLATVGSTDVTMVPGSVFGVRLDHEVSYQAPWAFASARRSYLNTR